MCTRYFARVTSTCPLGIYTILLARDTLNRSRSAVPALLLELESYPASATKNRFNADSRPAAGLSAAVISRTAGFYLYFLFVSRSAAYDQGENYIRGRASERTRVQERFSSASRCKIARARWYIFPFNSVNTPDTRGARIPAIFFTARRSTVWILYL